MRQEGLGWNFDSKVYIKKGGWDPITSYETKLN